MLLLWQVEERARTVQAQADVWRRAAQALTQLHSTHSQHAQQADAAAQQVRQLPQGFARGP